MLIVRRILLLLAIAFPAIAMPASASTELPRQWDPGAVAVNPDPANTVLLRPGQILAGPGDAADVQRRRWRQHGSRTADQPRRLADELADELGGLIGSRPTDRFGATGSWGGFAPGSCRIEGARAAARARR